jgi:hypothetical protein
MRGTFVRMLFAGKAPSGENQVVWEGSGNGGDAVADGPYIVNMRINGTIQNRALILSR